jgi:hypothetical protein
MPVYTYNVLMNKYLYAFYTHNYVFLIRVVLSTIFFYRFETV